MVERLGLSQNYQTRKMGNPTRFEKGEIPLKAPEWLTERESQIYREYVRVHRKEWKSQDLDLVVQFVRLVIRMRDGDTDYDKDLRHLCSMSRVLGIAPIDRMKREGKKAKEKKEVSPLGKILGMPAKGETA